MSFSASFNECAVAQLLTWQWDPPSNAKSNLCTQ
jgi:hypothetical protein